MSGPSGSDSPLWVPSGDRRTPTCWASQSSMTASTTSRAKRARFSTVPPYASERRLLSELRNWWIG